MSMGTKMTMGIIVGNRGFFPGHLAETGREAMIDRDAEGVGQKTPPGRQERVLGGRAGGVVSAETDLFETPAVGDRRELIADIDGPLGREIAEGVEVHHVACVIKLGGFSRGPKLGPILQAES